MYLSASPLAIQECLRVIGFLFIEPSIWSFEPNLSLKVMIKGLNGDLGLPTRCLLVGAGAFTARSTSGVIGARQVQTSDLVMLCKSSGESLDKVLPSDYLSEVKNIQSIYSLL